MDTNRLGSGMLAGILDPIRRAEAMGQAAATAAATTAATGAPAASTTAASEPSDPTLDALAATLSDASAGIPPEILDRVKAFGDHRLFFQSYNADAFLTAANSILVAGGDLNLFLRTAAQVRNVGDQGAFYEAAANVMDKGDYDDLRRFLNVSQTVMSRGESLDKYYALSARTLDQAPDDFESVIFAAQTTLSYGGTLDDFADIQSTLNMHGFDGRNNLVDYHRVLVAARQSHLNVTGVIQMMAQEARQVDDGRETLDQMMKIFRLEDTRPDFNLFDRIERVDSGPMTITQGESAALFCQAISSVHGLLPSQMLAWSSEEFGAAGRGNYLDLSKLGPGTYHFVAKIDGGGDTAIKTVIVLPKTGDDGNNGHGNDPGKVDPSNPGKSKSTEQSAAPAPAAPAPAAPAATQSLFGGEGLSSLFSSLGLGGLSSALLTFKPEGLVNMLASLDMNSLSSVGSALNAITQMAASQPVTGREDLTPFEKVWRLYSMHEDNLTADQVYDFLDQKIGRRDIINFLHQQGATTLAEQYASRTVSTQAVVQAMLADPQLYDKSTAFLRQHVSADEVAQFLSSNGDTQAEVAESLWLLGYRDQAQAPAPTQTTAQAPAPAAPAAPAPSPVQYQPPAQRPQDHDNGHGNDPGKFDPSNPGNSKSAVRAAYEANAPAADDTLTRDQEARIRANLKLLALTADAVDQEKEILNLLREIKALNEQIAEVDKLIQALEAYEMAKHKDKQAAHDHFMQLLQTLMAKVGPDERGALAKVRLPEPGNQQGPAKPDAR